MATSGTSNSASQTVALCTGTELTINVEPTRNYSPIQTHFWPLDMLCCAAFRLRLYTNEKTLFGLLQLSSGACLLCSDGF